MKCPECERTGQKSKLYMPDFYSCTDMGGSQDYYDEDGHHHYHEVNHSSGQGRCSNGHLLDVVASTKCEAPSCSYGREQTITFTGSVPVEPERQYITLPFKTFASPRRIDIRSRPPRLRCLYGG